MKDIDARKKVRRWKVVGAAFVVGALVGLGLLGALGPKRAGTVVVSVDEVPAWTSALQEGRRVRFAPSVPHEDGELASRDGMRVEDVIDEQVVEGRGRLEGAEQKRARAIIQTQLEKVMRDWNSFLRFRSIDGHDLSLVEREAELRYRVESASAYLDAFDKGAYYLEAPEEARGGNFPGCILMRLPGTLEGEPVVVTVVVALKDYPNVEAARAYLDDRSRLSAAERVHAFNAMSYARRKREIETYLQIRSQEQISPADLRRMYSVIPRGVLVVTDGYWLRLPH